MGRPRFVGVGLLFCCMSLSAFCLADLSAEIDRRLASFEGPRCVRHHDQVAAERDGQTELLLSQALNRTDAASLATLVGANTRQPHQASHRD